MKQQNEKENSKKGIIGKYNGWNGKERKKGFS